MELKVMACVQPASRDSPSPCASGMGRELLVEKARAIHEIVPSLPSKDHQ